MRRVVFAVLSALALSTSAAWASPPAPCDCVSCLLEPDRLCTEWFTIQIRQCRDFSADHCPAASVSQTQATAGDFACTLSGEMPQSATSAAEAADPAPPLNR